MDKLPLPLEDMSAAAGWVSIVMHRCNPSQSKLHVKNNSNRASIKGRVVLFLKGVGGNGKALRESI